MLTRLLILAGLAGIPAFAAGCNGLTLNPVTGALDCVGTGAVGPPGPPGPICGSDTQILFNSGGACGFSSRLTFGIVSTNPTPTLLVGESLSQNALAASHKNAYFGLLSTTSQSGVQSNATNTFIGTVWNGTSNDGGQRTSVQISNGVASGNTFNLTLSGGRGALNNIESDIQLSGTGTVSQINNIMARVMQFNQPVTLYRGFDHRTPVGTGALGAYQHFYAGQGTGGGTFTGTLTDHYAYYCDTLGMGTNRYCLYTVTDKSYLGGGLQLPAIASKILMTDASGNVGSATAGTNYAPPTNGTNGQTLTSNGAGGFGTPVALEMFGVPVAGATFKRSTQQVNIGDTDLYTCTAGAKQCMVANSMVYNSSAGNINWFLEVKHLGIYYRMTTATNTTPGNTNTTNAVAFPLMAGDTLAINTTTTNGLHVIASVVEFDSASPLKAAMLFGLTTGNNTIFTVTSGKTASLSGCTAAMTMGVTAACSPLIGFVADAGGTRIVSLNNVPAAGAVAPANQLIPALSVPANNRAANTFATNGFSMASQDFLSINVNTGAATQIAFAVWIEI